MTLKDLFEGVEGGALSYEQLAAKITEKGAKFADLSEGKYVDKQKYTDDLAARDTRIQDLEASVTSRETDVANLQEQLKTAGTDSSKLKELTTQFSDLQAKYNQETQAYQEQLKKQALDFAVTEFAGKQKFTSNAAKRDFINAMKAKNLQVDNGVLIGATDFMTAYAQENADAFVKEEPTQPEPEQPSKPEFVAPTGALGGNGDNPNPISFNFTGVRRHN